MFDMTGYAELKRLLTKVEAIEEKLMPNELEMLRSLKAKYVEPLTPDPFDVTSLNVMLRNVEIRKGYRFDPSSPLKKALLTGFHSTAKHNATKAVSPSSETMRTI